MRRFRRKYHLGLSLLELMIALALTALIAAVSYPSLSLIIRSWNSIEFGTTPNDEFAAERFIRHQIEQASIVFKKERSTRENLLLFSGDPARLSFVSPMDKFTNKPGLYLTSFEIEEKNASQNLVFEYQLYRLNADGEFPTAKKRTLIEDVLNAELRYYSHTDKKWLPEWLDQKQLPQLVMLRFIDSRSRPRRLVVAPSLANTVLSSSGF